MEASTLGSRSTRVAATSFLILMVDGYDTLMVSFIAPLLARQWHLQPTDIGRLFAVGYVGAVVGAIGMGPLADRFGRKPLLIAALALAGVATLLCSRADTPGALMALRFVAGLALGGALPAVSALTAEHARPRRQSGTVTLMYIGFPMGAVVGGAITSGLLHNGWQPIFLTTGVACLLAAALAATLPESPRATAPALPQARAPRFVEQFADGRLWPALMLWLGLFSMLLLTYFLLSWTPSVIVARGGSLKLAALGGVVLNLGGIVGAALVAPVIDRLGPYRPVAIMVTLGTVFVALIGSIGGSLPAMMALLFATGVCVLGGQLNFPAMSADLFPLRVRATGSGWTLGFGRIGSILGPLIGGALIAARLSPKSLFLVAAIPALVAAVALSVAVRLRRTAH